MKKLYALIVPLCLVLGACTTADEPGVAGEGGIPMSFGASGETVGTRALLDGTTISQNGNQLKVYDRYTPQNGTAVLYMEGTEVTCDGSAWTYSPLKYWTEEGTHSFLAYLHKAGSVKCDVTDGCYPFLRYDAERHELYVTGWTIGTDNQFDFLYARHKRSMTEANPHRVVEFQMSHLLCAVQFNIVNLYDVNQEISISGFQLSGLNNNQWAAIPGQPNGEVIYTEEASATQATLSGTTTATVAYNKAFNAFAGVGTVGDDGCLLMWPHDAGQYEDLTISFQQGEDLKSVSLKSGSTTHWEAGQKYTYNLYIKDDRINLQVTVRPWITDDIDLN